MNPPINPTAQPPVTHPTKPQAKPKARIFIVEDDSVIASVEEWRLNKLGYTICGHATNGADALLQVKETTPDLVLLDINLDGEMDGIEIAEVLARESDIPFIFLTAHSEDAVLKRVKKTLQYGYIKKPFTDDDLRIGIELAFAKNRFIRLILTNNALYEQVLDQFPLGIIVTNNEGMITFTNETARLLTQKQDPAGLGHFREIVCLIDTTTGKPLENLLDRVRSERAVVWFPQTAGLQFPNKKPVPVAGNAAPLFNNAGSPAGMVVTLLALGEKNFFRILP